jgi:hypothetical protein
MSDAITWDELADIYKKHTGRSARIHPMSEVLKWAESQPKLFYVDNEGYLYLRKGDDDEAPSTKSAPVSTELVKGRRALRLEDAYESGRSHGATHRDDDWMEALRLVTGHLLSYGIESLRERLSEQSEHEGERIRKRAYANDFGWPIGRPSTMEIRIGQPPLVHAPTSEEPAE